MTERNDWTKNFWVHCGECGHSWIAAILPMAVDDFARVAGRACCPRGHRARVYCGKGPAQPHPDRAAGGKARAASLTPERRSEIASEAANKRWHRGESE